MELDWTTFLLEIFNFLILVWILKHFLYRPVTTAIAKRRAHIDKTLADAQAIQDQATALQAENQRLRSAWEQKRAQLETQLTEEISAKRERMLAELAATAAQEQEKHRALETQKQQELRHTLEQKAGLHGAQFAAKLLARFASPELESRLLDALLEDLRQMPPEKLEPLLQAAQRNHLQVKIASAFSLNAQQRQQLLDALTQVVGQTMPADFSERPDLLCGLQISLGPWVMNANLQGELAFFQGKITGES